MSYLKLLTVFAFAFGVNLCAPNLLAHMSHLNGVEVSVVSALWCFVLFLVFGWLCSKVAKDTIFPSFTLQLLVGIVLHDALAPLSTQLVLSVVVCIALAAIILKSGGDEISRKHFLKIAIPTLLIATMGYLVTFFIMFAVLVWFGLDSKLAALLSAIIGSTDPAALIPTLKTLTFKPQYKQVSNLSVAESAFNDAVGAIFTGAIAAMILNDAKTDNVEALTIGLLARDNLLLLAQQFGFGIFAGLIGWVGMSAFERYKRKSNEAGMSDTPYDFALVLAVPLATFLLAQMIHGNGFLAAFVAGLLANFNHGTHYFHDLLHSLEVKVESVAKPIIFMMLGPFVTLEQLGDTALLGLLISFAFIALARPVAVFVSLLPTAITLKEKLFLCVVRETGVIPVVLAVVTVSQFPSMIELLPLTAWVVICTLTILPAITPWWAHKLQMIE